MKTGRRVANPAAKKLAGTYRNDRHGNIVALVTPARSVPVMPQYLSREARLVWAEEIDRVTGCGALEADSSLFASYCEVEAMVRGCWIAGETPKAAYLTELRRMRELLGIAGLRSRLGRATAQDAPAKASPFSAAPK